MEILLVVAIVVLLAGATFFVIARLRAGRSDVGAGPAPVTPAAARGGLGSMVRSLFATGASEEAWAQLEGVLLRADVGPQASVDLVNRLKDDVGGGADPAEALRTEIERMLSGDIALDVHGSPAVVMIVGVNGSGKTTTIGKLAKRLAADGRKVTLAGSDTFRAAAGEQLDVWAERSGAHIVKQDRGADPAAVAFDAVKSAQARGSDVVIVDTAGRLHTRTPLMDELAKVRRSLEKAAGRAPDEVLLVLDAGTGQNGIAQARAFTEAVGVTGVALTKMDGTAKGGIVLAVREELGVPVKLMGTGEGAGDLETFDPAAFAERLVDG